MLARWIPASQGAVRLNFDQSSRGNPRRARCVLGGEPKIKGDRNQWTEQETPIAGQTPHLDPKLKIMNL